MRSIYAYFATRTALFAGAAKLAYWGKCLAGGGPPAIACVRVGGCRIQLSDGNPDLPRAVGVTTRAGRSLSPVRRAFMASLQRLPNDAQWAPAAASEAPVPRAGLASQTSGIRNRNSIAEP